MSKTQYLNHFRNPRTLEDGDARVFDVRGCVLISIQAGTGATVTHSRVNSLDATEHGNGEDTVGAGAFDPLTVQWPFYRVSVAGGSAVVSVV